MSSKTDDGREGDDARVGGVISIPNDDRSDGAGCISSDVSHLQIASSNDSEVFDIRGAYPFLSDAKTIEYVRKSKVMFIMRGPPGCGKSSAVQLLIQLYPSVVVCSADDFFCQEDGTYCREADKLGDAHTFCQLKAARAIQDNKLHITIDNTNIKVWEMKHYFSLAHHNGYTVLIVIPRTPWAFDVQQLVKKNTHGVSLDYIRSKVEKFEEALPLFWGWFLNDDGSVQLRNTGFKYFSECIRLMKEFSLFLPILDDDGVHSFGDVYDSRSSCLHCTSFFAGYKNKNMDVVRYAHSKSVSQSTGLIFTLAITGVVYTPRTAGLRVSLTEDQLALFYESGNAVGDRSKPKSTPSKSSTYSSRAEAGRAEFLARTVGNVNGRKAHITLGYSKTSHASQTGQDVLDIIACESRGWADTITLDDQTSISYYGEGRCLVKFHQPILVDSLFSGCF